MLNSAHELRTRLSGWASRAALVGEDGVAVTYGELLEAGARFVAGFGQARRLVFIEASNRPEALAAYFACLVAGHPVYLFGEKDDAALPALIERYRPNRVIYPLADDPVRVLHDEVLDMHPELAVLLSTSGSTGSPKFVKLSFGNIASNALSIAEYLRIAGDDRAMTSLQFNYSYGLSVVNSHLFTGASLLLSDASVTEERFWRAFRTHGATSFAGVPYTFELLEKMGPAWAETPGLRTVTQAGGALSPARIEQIARLADANNWRFYVMYGQTECAPRIAYLPPEMAASHARCIGVAIPGGALEIVDEAGNVVLEPDVAGELVYRGPNVMLGYAADAAGLAGGDPPGPHRTGDVACRTSDGLFYITGRLSRFVKPFGLRVNLDELQEKLWHDYPEAVCTGNDQTIVVALPGEGGARNEAVVAGLSSMLKLPAASFRVVNPSVIPRLANGKVDFRSILDAANGDQPRSGPGAALGLLFSRRFVHQVIEELAMILGVKSAHWHGIGHIYATVLNLPRVGDDATFVDLAGDSLSYVQVTVALEEYLGKLPANWETRTVGDLEQEAASASSI